MLSYQKLIMQLSRKQTILLQNEYNGTQLGNLEVNKSLFVLPQYSELILCHLKFQANFGILCNSQEYKSRKKPSNIRKNLRLISINQPIKMRSRYTKRCSSEERHTIIEQYDSEGAISNRFIKGRFLGKGGYARSTRQKTACKIIPKNSLKAPHVKQKLMYEIKIHSSISHEHIVNFEHYFEDSHNVYILLELCSNHTLYELLRRRKRLSQPEIRYYSIQIIKALQYLHSKRVIHRDIKLGNLLLNSNMEIKLSDFGFSTHIEYEGQRKKTVCGTPNFIAPEIIDGTNGHSYEIDVWSLGVTIYTLLVGRPPFETPDVKSTFNLIRRNKYSFPDYLTEEAKSVVSDILVTDPQQRIKLDDILSHQFFRQQVPDAIPSSSLACPLPKFRLVKSKEENQSNVCNFGSTDRTVDEDYTTRLQKPVQKAQSVFQLDADQDISQDKMNRDSLIDTNREMRQSIIKPYLDEIGNYSDSINNYKSSEIQIMQEKKVIQKEADYYTSSFQCQSNIVSVISLQSIPSIEKLQLDKQDLCQQKIKTAFQNPAINQVNGLNNVAQLPQRQLIQPNQSQLSAQDNLNRITKYDEAQDLKQVLQIQSPKLEKVDSRIERVQTLILSSTSVKEQAYQAAINNVNIYTRIEHAQILSARQIPSNLNLYQESSLSVVHRILSDKSGLQSNFTYGQSNNAKNINQQQKEHSRTNELEIKTEFTQKQEFPVKLHNQSNNQKSGQQTQILDNLSSIEQLPSMEYISSESQDTLSNKIPYAVQRPRLLTVHRASISNWQPVSQPRSSSVIKKFQRPSIRKITPPVNYPSSPPLQAPTPYRKNSNPNPRQSVMPHRYNGNAKKQRKLPITIGTCYNDGYGPAIWVQAWIDYSAQYGLGYILSNGSVGVIYNDSTKAVISSGAQNLWYQSRNGQDHYIIDSPPRELAKKVKLLKLFRDQLIGLNLDLKRETSDVYIKRWHRSRHAILFKLSSMTTQVSFNDQSEILLTNQQVTFVNANGLKFSSNLEQALSRKNSDLSRRLNFTKEMLCDLLDV